MVKRAWWVCNREGAGIIRALYEKHRDSHLGRWLEHGRHCARSPAGRLGPNEYGARVAAVISNKADAKGLQFAQEHGIATAVLDHKAFASREDFDAALAQQIDTYQPHLVVLAGFMRILTPGFVAHYAGRLLNIHPSLLPAFPGPAHRTSARWMPVRICGLHRALK